MGDELTKVYDLREDAEHVAAVQRATLTTKEFGLVPEHGLFGSPEWWRAIEDGRLPVHTIDGVITRVFMSGHDDYPEFEITSVGGRTSWTRVTSGEESGGLEREAKAALYEVGRRVRLRYVVQRFRQTMPGLEEDHSVLDIWIGQPAGQTAGPQAV